MIKDILVASDDSDSSKRALDFAIDLATKYGSALHLIHVITEIQLPEGLRGMEEVQKIEGQRSDVLRFAARKVLTEADERAKKQGVKDVHYALEEGDAPTQIINYAKEHGVDLIVMGTRGLGPLKGMLLGSVSRKVCNLADVNCLTIR